MNLPAYARAAARLLRGSAQPDYFPNPAARARRLSTIERALVARQRRKRWLWLGTAAATAAVFALVVVGVASRTPAPLPGPSAVSLSVTSNGSDASVSDNRGTHALTESLQLAVGSSVITSASGTAAFRLSTGTRLALGTEGRISVVSIDRTQRFRLARGAIDAKVARLKPGERFVIETLDATVEVRGTAFRVTVLDPAHACEGGERTRVRVSEGVVNVTSRGDSIEVPAGSSWPARCGVESRRKVGADDALQQPIAVRDARPPNPKLRRVESTAPPASTSEHSSARQTVAVATESAEATEAESPERTSLSHQNDKFERAVRARQSGDLQLALRNYREFVEEFPTSPLAQNARVEVMRLLARSNPGAATQAASDYLKRYPTGFAREEAERLLAAP